MHDLVKLAIESHGGLDEWKKVRQVSARLSPSGAGFKARGPIGEDFTRISNRVTAETGTQKVVIDPFIKPGQRGIYEPHRAVIESYDGTLLEVLDNPRESLTTMKAGMPWSGPQIIYFIGYSIWMYFGTPYSLLTEGIECEEVEPWMENGETWRALKVTYPASVPSHSTEQIYYFDDRGLIRRQDYDVDVRQDLKAAHYLRDYERFDGFLFPRKREIVLRGPDRVPVWDRVLISASFDDYKVTRVGN